MKKIFMVSTIFIHSLIFLSCTSDLIILFNTPSNQINENFNDPNQVLNKWKLMYDAKIISSLYGNGYIEITGYEINKKGVIYNDQDRLDAGDINIDFSIRTGPDKNPNGADGFAMTIADVPTGSDFVNYLNNVDYGGCLGYGVNGSVCAKAYTVESFHIEFDTWKNSFDAPLGDDNHIAITADGDPSNHLLYKSIDIEDNEWHPIHIEIKGSNIKVTMNQVQLINASIPGFRFKGGFIMFSGSTGSFKNYHSIDDLMVYKQNFPLP